MEADRQIEPFLQKIDHLIAPPQVDRDLRIVAQIRGHDRRDEPPEGGMAMNAQPPARSRLQGAGCTVRFVDLGQKVGGACEVLSADLGQADLARGAVQEPRAQSILKLLNVTADHRPRDVEVTGRGGEATVLNDADEGGDAAQTIHAATPSISAA
jgi:hypothetical protein